MVRRLCGAGACCCCFCIVAWCVCAWHVCLQEVAVVRRWPHKRCLLLLLLLWGGHKGSIAVCVSTGPLPPRRTTAPPPVRRRRLAPLRNRPSQETFGAMAKTEKIAYILEQVGGGAVGSGPLFRRCVASVPAPWSGEAGCCCVGCAADASGQLGRRVGSAGIAAALPQPTERTSCPGAQLPPPTAAPRAPPAPCHPPAGAAVPGPQGLCAGAGAEGRGRAQRGRRAGRGQGQRVQGRPTKGAG